MAASLPRSMEDQTVYDTSPQEMVDFIRRFVEMGVKIVEAVAAAHRHT